MLPPLAFVFGIKLEQRSMKQREDVWWTHMISSVYSHHDFQQELERQFCAFRFDSPCTYFIHYSYPGKFVNILSLALVSSL